MSDTKTNKKRSRATKAKEPTPEAVEEPVVADADADADAEAPKPKRPKREPPEIPGPSADHHIALLNVLADVAQCEQTKRLTSNNEYRQAGVVVSWFGIPGGISFGKNIVLYNLNLNWVSEVPPLLVTFDPETTEPDALAELVYNGLKDELRRAARMPPRRKGKKTE